MKAYAITIQLMLVLGSGSLAQNCYLSTDNITAEGLIYRRSSLVPYSNSGTELRLETTRTGDEYNIKAVLIQSTNDGAGINIMVSGKHHSLVFNMSNGKTASLNMPDDAIVRSKTGGEKNIEFTNTYVLDTTAFRQLRIHSIKSIELQCYGTAISTGLNSDDISLTIGEGQSLRFMTDMQCLAKPMMPPKQNDQPKNLVAYLDVITFKNGTKRAGVITNVVANKVVALKTIEGDELVFEFEEIKSIDFGGEKPSNGLPNRSLKSSTDELLTEIRDILKEEKPKAQADFVPRVFGFGVYFKTNFLFSTIMVANTDLDVAVNKFMSGASINASFNAGMKKKVGFRFEPFVDFLVTNTDNQFGSTSVKGETGMLETGMRLLLVIRRNRVNIYPGVSGSYLNVAGKSTSGLQTVKASRSGGSIGLILGGEYLLTPHIGVRIESGAMYYGLGKTKGNALITNKAQNVFGSFARLGGSFYF